MCVYFKCKMKYTRKKRHRQINGEIIGETAGWKSVRIYGDPYERGFAHGYLLRDDIAKSVKSLTFLIKTFIKTTVAHYLQRCQTEIIPILQNYYPELFREMQGISAGSAVRLVIIVGLNSFMSLYPNEDAINRCSAFIATGNATEKGDIVMAHNTHADFISGQQMNIVLRIEPTEGNTIVMQTAAGLVASSSDWFLCESGIIGCETTIAYTNYDPDFKHGHPYFCRIRKAMQYANTLDEYAETMIQNNAGDYACSWQFGDTNTGEIMLLELGLKFHSVQRTFDGVFYGMNSAMDFRLRNMETTDISHTDGTTSLGARNNRLNYLLNERYYGSINTTNAKRILADHYDEIAAKNQMSSRNICKHSEEDLEKLVGCTDGKVVNTKLAKSLRFYGRFGSSCGRTLDVSEYCKKHPTVKSWQPYLTDFIKYPWTKL